MHVLAGWKVMVFRAWQNRWICVYRNYSGRKAARKEAQLWKSNGVKTVIVNMATGERD